MLPGRDAQGREEAVGPDGLRGLGPVDAGLPRRVEACAPRRGVPRAARRGRGAGAGGSSARGPRPLRSRTRRGAPSPSSTVSDERVGRRGRERPGGAKSARRTKECSGRARSIATIRPRPKRAVSRTPDGVWPGSVGPRRRHADRPEPPHLLLAPRQAGERRSERHGLAAATSGRRRCPRRTAGRRPLP